MGQMGQVGQVGQVGQGSPLSISPSRGEVGLRLELLGTVLVAVCQRTLVRAKVTPCYI